MIETVQSFNITIFNGGVYMAKVILQVYPSMGDVEEMKKRRPIGRDSEAY
jgi:hypothetical protein